MKILTKEQQEFIKQNYQTMIPRHMAKELNLSGENVRAYMRSTKLQTVYNKKLDDNKLTEEQVEQILREHKSKSPTELSKEMGLSRQKVYNFLYKRKLIGKRDQNCKNLRINEKVKTVHYERVNDGYSNTQWENYLL